MLVNFTSLHVLRTALQAGRSWVQFPIGSLGFFIDLILPTALTPEVDLASVTNDYLWYFLGIKAVGEAG